AFSAEDHLHTGHTQTMKVVARFVCAASAEARHVVAEDGGETAALCVLHHALERHTPFRARAADGVVDIPPFNAVAVLLRPPLHECLLVGDRTLLHIGRAPCIAHGFDRSRTHFAPPFAANMPRSTFLNRASFFFAAISLIIAAYSVADGVLPFVCHSFFSMACSTISFALIGFFDRASVSAAMSRMPLRF